MLDAVVVVKDLLQDYSDNVILQLLLIGAKSVKETADSEKQYYKGLTPLEKRYYKGLTPLESANEYLSRRMDHIINYVGGVLDD